MKVRLILDPQAEGGYTIYCPAFSGCVSQGESKKEAVENFRDALEAWLEVKTSITRARARREVVEVTV